MNAADYFQKKRKDTTWEKEEEMTSYIVIRTSSKRLKHRSVAINVRTKAMENRIVEGGQILREVKFRRVIFQGVSLMLL